MTKEVQMSIKMEPELRDQFMAVAATMHRPAAQIVRDLMRSYIQRQETPNINLYGDGSFVRDYLFLDDVVSALVFASENIERTNGRMFCLGSGQGITLKDAFLKVIAAAALVTGRKVELVQVPPPGRAIGHRI